MTSYYQKIIAGLVLSLAIFLIVFRFTDIPRVWIDEGIFTETAKNLAWHGQQGIQIAPGKIDSSAVVATGGYPLIFPVAASFSMFGTGLWQARLPLILYMLGLVFLFYSFIKKRHGFYWAIYSVLILLSFSPFYGNGRPVQGEVPGIAFLLLGALLFLYWENMQFNNKHLAFWSGISFGLAAATKPLFLIVLVPALVVSLFVLKKEISKKNLIRFLFGVILPIIIWIAVQFPNADLFKKAISAYVSGNSDSSASSLIMVKINLISFFTELTPLLFMLLMIFIFSASTYLFFVKKKKIFNWAEFILFSFVVFNWLAYLKGPSWYRHFFPANIILFLLFCSTVASLWNYVRDIRVKNMIVVIALLLLSGQFYHLIFLSQNSPLNRTNQNNTLSEYLSAIGPDKKVFFNESIAAIIFLKHDNYFQYLRPTDYLEFGSDNLNNIPYDYIIGGDNYVGKRTDRSCYSREEVGKYTIFKRSADCMKSE